MNDVRQILAAGGLLFLSACCAPSGALPADGGTDAGGATLSDGGTDGGDPLCALAPASTLDEIYPGILGGCSIAGCHAVGANGALPPSGLVFTDAPSLYAAVVNQPSSEVTSAMRVLPGAPSRSYLYAKLAGTQTFGARMPFGGPYLDGGALAEVAGWICAGAPPPADGGLADGGIADAGAGDAGEDAGPPPNPTPTLSAISPSTVTAGGGALALTLTGTGFLSISTVELDGSPISFTFGSSTTLSASVPAAVVAVGGSHGITVVNPPPGGGSSAPAILQVENPAPTIGSLSPNPVPVGGAPFTLTISGAGFVQDSAVTFDGAAATATFVSGSTLTIPVPTESAAGGYPVAVTNPAPGGGSASASLTFQSSTGPTITGVSPAQGAAGSAFTLTVTGSGYVCGATQSQLLFNGAALTVTSCAATQLAGAVPATAAGSYPVEVKNPQAAGGLTSNVVSYTIAQANPLPAISSLSPSAALAGSSAFTLTVNGSGFVPGSTVDWNGSARATTDVSSVQLTASILASDVASAGSFPVTVVTPAPGGGTSNGASFTVTAPVATPAISSLSPCDVIAGSGSFTLTIDGSGFASGASVSFGGSPLTPSSVTSSQLVVSVPGSLVAAAPAGDETDVTVTNPGGAASGPFIFAIASQSRSFASDVQPIFSQSCALSGCHVQGGPAPMSLQSGQAYGNLVNVLSSECASRMRVLPCGPDPTQSYLVAKITDTDICQGSKMPKTGSLSSSEQQILLDWVAEDAPNN